MVKYNTGCLIQLKDVEGGNCGQAKIKKVLVSTYHVQFNTERFSIKELDLYINIHGQLTTAKTNLKPLKNRQITIR